MKSIMTLRIGVFVNVVNSLSVKGRATLNTVHFVTFFQKKFSKI